VRREADRVKLRAKYEKNRINPELLKQLAQLSRHPDGPLQAQRVLAKHGIALVIARHLPRTYLDGAALKRADGSPVVAATLRYDRIDHFWFCLFHELGHVAKHLDGDEESFFDDLSLEASDRKEQEADECATRGLIPDDAWNQFREQRDFSPLAVMTFADRLGIHPAIVAGRIRYTEKNFRLLSQFVGSGQIRRHFPREFDGAATSASNSNRRGSHDGH
jgi:HTH-type transcriptional regulator/antitoxin HigA